jgi:hypothetical protein
MMEPGRNRPCNVPLDEELVSFVDDMGLRLDGGDATRARGYSIVASSSLLETSTVIDDVRACDCAPQAEQKRALSGRVALHEEQAGTSSQTYSTGLFQEYATALYRSSSDAIRTFLSRN